MGKAWDWLRDKDDDHPIHHVSWPWDDLDDEPRVFEDHHPDETYANEDYESSRLSHSEDD